MNYLIIRLKSLGNVAMLAPIVASLSKNYENDRFYILSKKPLDAMFYGMKNVKLISMDEVEAQNQTLPNDIDVVIDLQANLRSLMLSLRYRLRLKPTYRIDYGRLEKYLMTITNAYSKPLPTEHERYVRTLVRAGLSADMGFTSLSTNENARKKVLSIYGFEPKSANRKQRLIGIAPFAKHKTNRLHYRTTKELINYFTADNDTRVFLFGAGKIETTWLEQWESIFPNTTSVAGRLPLEEELELMRELDVMYCMDSANQHLASLVGLRAISVWCGTDPKLGFYGFKQRADDCVSNNIRCRPCTIHGTEHCRYGNYLCKQISVEELVNRL